MKTRALFLAGLVTHVACFHAPATILLNEIHMRTPLSTNSVEADANFEFVELKSSTGGAEPCTDLWVIIIDNDGGSVGEIKEQWRLVDESEVPLSTGANGLLLLGDDYNKAGSPYESAKAPQTAVADPQGMSQDNIPNKALTVLLVQGYTNPAPLPGDTDIDVDKDDDGILDWVDPTPPASRYSTVLWTTIVDSVGYNGDSGALIKPTYGPTNLTGNTIYDGVLQAGTASTYFVPHTLSRHASNTTANSRTAWYGGTTPSGASGSSTAYGTNWFNLTGATWKGLATPGQTNFSAAPVSPVFRLNELNLNPPGTPAKMDDGTFSDGNFEYVEIVNITANQSGGSNYTASLANYALLVVDSGGASGLGRIREAWDLSRVATGSNGLLVLGDGYAEGFSPFVKNADPATQHADPSTVTGDTKYSNMGMGDLSNNGTTILLVTNFTGKVDDDLDSNDDGVLNAVVPYTLVDGVSVPEVDINGALVAGKSGYSAAKPDIVVNTRHYNADNLSRIRGNTTVNSTAAWAAGVLGSRSPYARQYQNGHYLPNVTSPFRGAGSPGQPNYSSVALPASGTLRLNEVHIDPPSAPDGTEFVEIISAEPLALMTNYWLLIVYASPAGSGTVKKVIDLRSQSTGANRLAIFADGIEEDVNILVPYLSGQTVRDDPESFNADGTENLASGYNLGQDNIPNSKVSVLLVAYTPPTATGTPATPESDLDANNDGVLDAAPAWTLVDGISTGNGVGGVPALGLGFNPGNISRINGNMTANSSAAWFGGEIAGNSALSFDFTSNFFGGFKGSASPGRHNPSGAPDNAATLLLNEVHINPPGGDKDREFVELRGHPAAAMSTNNYSLLLVDNDGVNTGKVLKVWDLDGATTGSNGLLLAGSGYVASTPWTGPAAPDAATALFSPEGMNPDDIGFSTDNLALTVLLVKNFKGRPGDDLDVGTDGNMALPDDHIFNTPVPWETLADSVAMQGYNTNLLPPALEGYIFPGTANVTQPFYTPDSVGRFLGNNTANSGASWYGANLAGTTSTSIEYSATDYFPSNLHGGQVTPGQANIAALTDDSDTDRDTVPYLMEIALGMDPFTSDLQKLPTSVFAVVNSVNQPTFRVTRPVGGVAGINYAAFASFNLQQWSLPTVEFSTTNNGDGTETKVYLVDPSFLPLLDVNKRVFFRLKVTRP